MNGKKRIKEHKSTERMIEKKRIRGKKKAARKIDITRREREGMRGSWEWRKKREIGQLKEEKKKRTERAKIISLMKTEREIITMQKKTNRERRGKGEKVLERQGMLDRL